MILVSDFGNQAVEFVDEARQLPCYHVFAIATSGPRITEALAPHGVLIGGNTVQILQAEAS